jgi:hypothetical protein
MALNFVKGKPVKADTDVKIVTDGSLQAQGDASNKALSGLPTATADELAKFLSEKMSEQLKAAYATPVKSMAVTSTDIKNSIYKALGLQVQEQAPSEDDEAEQIGVVTEEASSEVLTLVDRFTQIQLLLEQMGADKLVEEHAELKKSLQSIAKSDQYADDKRVQLHGTHNNYVEFSAKSNKTEITDKPGLINCMGQTMFNEVATVTLGNAKKVVPEAKLSQFTTIVPGSRNLKHINVGN